MVTDSPAEQPEVIESWPDAIYELLKSRGVRTGNIDNQGWGLDIGTTWRFHDHFELVAAWFSPGRAFEDAGDAFLGKLQVRYRF